MRGTPIAKVPLQAAAGPGLIGTPVRLSTVQGRFYELRVTCEAVFHATSQQTLDASFERLFPTGRPMRFVADSNELVVGAAIGGAGVVGFAFLFEEYVGK